MKRPRTVRLLPLLLLLPACVGVDPMRVQADRATYDWFAPMTRAYIEADPKLDAAAKATHLRSLDAWNARIAADEAAAGVK
jgi:hypothetical protein